MQIRYQLRYIGFAEVQRKRLYNMDLWKALKWKHLKSWILNSSFWSLFLDSVVKVFWCFQKNSVLVLHFFYQSAINTNFSLKVIKIYKKLCLPSIVQVLTVYNVCFALWMKTNFFKNVLKMNVHNNILTINFLCKNILQIQ